ncbi:MAG: hypothetical protein QF527_00410 [SAR86 cluster bacterium]|nr:hypothetical protein [SAR86 cluster bacterium]|tara:strand:+ start:848 stop:1297 length:450 start_codon:yes stop_codon:yes gene_type:complete
MKPEINIALMNAAQEILTRFSPLIEDEYEQSRLNSWGALILISAMKLNQSYSSLVKENDSMINWLTSTKQIYSKELLKEIDLIQVEEGLEQSVLDEQNQLLRAILVKAHKEVDSSDDIEVKRDCLKLLREMHSHRKVSDLIGLLQQADS